MNFELTDEQQMLGETLRRYLREQYDFDTRRERRAGMALDRDLWNDLGQKLGILGATLPERVGGLGGGPEEAMVVAEALGEALVVEPYLDCLVVAAGILESSDHDERDALLEALGRGEKVVTLAHDEPVSGLDAARIEARASQTDGGWRLDGTKPVVSWAPAADRFVVSAQCDDGLGLFLVDPKSPGIEVHAYKLIDDRPAADLVFESVALPADARLAGGNAAADILDRVRDSGVAALCAEAVGVMRRMYDDTVAYTKEREQFGQPLAGFQALQHRMVDMYMELEQARAATHLATLALEGEPSDRRRACSAAKATIGRAVRFVSQNAVQLHGAMGMTDELPVGHFFRRAAAIEREFGATGEHVRRYAEEVRSAA